MVAAVAVNGRGPSTPALQRVLFDVSRDAEYFAPRELQAQTGQRQERFVSVILKELLDNALDACESSPHETDHPPEVCARFPVAPVVTIETVDRLDGTRQLTVGDNGPGLTPAVVHRLFNFATRTSDKAAYRSPTRGAQGNALKTVLGIPWALGMREPISIESCGVRHTIHIGIDPAGTLRLRHEETPTAVLDGTRVTVCVPLEGQDCDPLAWARAFAAVNPHLSVKISEVPTGELPCSEPSAAVEIFTHGATVAFPGGWRKFLPGHLTSAWWYSLDDLKRLVFQLIGKAQAGGPDLLLGDFVSQFRNCSAKPKKKAVRDALPTITVLQDFEGQEERVATLYASLREAGTAPSPDTLGTVGQEHFRACFDRWYHVQRFWYAPKSGVQDGIPFAVEVAIAETVEHGGLVTGVNFSPTFEDPLAGTRLKAGSLDTYGVQNFLASAHASPVVPQWYEEEGDCVTVAVHLVCPALEFLDRGKTRLKLQPWMADLVAQTLWKAAKPRHDEEALRCKDAAKAEKVKTAQEKVLQAMARKEGTPQCTRKDAVFMVIPDAWRHATGDGAYRVSARNLYYSVRDFIQAYTPKELDYDYFSQDLLTQYQQVYGPIQGLYYDPRGILYEPHTKRVVYLGTRAVEDYVFPAWQYDKILYVEKKTVWPILETAQFAERYDMAIVTGEGYATEAMRVLFAQAATDRQYQIFVLHDADPYGYNIARTLREATDRMPGYAVDVLDLGLFVEEAQALGKRTETFSRKVALPAELVLSEAARVWFEGRAAGRDAKGKVDSWICERVELNALTAPELVAYIEQQLQRVGVRGKVIPDDETLRWRAQDALQGRARTMVTETVETLLNESLAIDAITDQITQAITNEIPCDAMRGWIENTLTRHPTQNWEGALNRRVAGLVGGKRYVIRARVQEAIREAFARHGATSGPGAQ